MRVGSPISYTDGGDFVTLDIAVDGINDTHIDWGTGANQVSAVDVPIADVGGEFTGTEIETALSEISLLDGTRPFTGTVGGIYPVASADLTTKEYVDSVIAFIQDYYLIDTVSDIGGIYYVAAEQPSGEAESSLTTAGLGTGDDQALFNFATISTLPGVNNLLIGSYHLHIHAEKTAGTKPVKIYFALYTRTSGGAETLRATSETSDYITSKTAIDLHANIAADVDINTTDRLVWKMFANVEATGSAATIVLYQEGTNNSLVSIPTTTEVLSSIFVRQDGTKSLTADWDAGSYKITAETFESDVATSTPPFIVASTTVVPNLNVDQVDGFDLDQVVTSGATPTFSADNFSDGGSNAIITLTQETNFETAYTHSQIAGGNSVHVSTTENTNWDTAYSHSQDNTQAHSDYLLNSGDDATTGRLTAAGFTTSQNIVLGDNSLTGVDTITFTDINGTIAGIENQNLVDKSAAETIAGAWLMNAVTLGGNIDFDGNQSIDYVLHTVADAAARDALTPVLGKIVWQTDELRMKVCVEV